jgi:hypothetical protein
MTRSPISNHHRDARALHPTPKIKIDFYDTLTPYILHPAPYILRPTPYILRPSPRIKIDFYDALAPYALQLQPKIKIEFFL